MSTFEEKNRESIQGMSRDRALQDLTYKWFVASSRHEYSYHFTWLGRPIIQFPQDVIALQEIFWRVKPDAVIETGIAHGGSLIFSASMLELLGGEGGVLGIDIDIRPNNRVEIENHPLSRRISMVQGSSIDKEIAQQAADFVAGKKRVLVILDSHHTHDHVRRELDLYSPWVTKNSYLVVLDTVIEDMPENFFPNRPWGKGNNPRTAVREFLKMTDRFEIDEEIQNKLLITVAPGGYLRCVKD